MYTSFEIIYELDKDGRIVSLDWEFMSRKLELLKRCFSDYEFLGWYSTGREMSPFEGDVEIH